MRAGTLNQRIMLQRPVVLQDSTGAEDAAWEDAREVSAKVSPIKGKEALTGGVVLADTDTRFIIRWAPDVAGEMMAKWRLLHRGVPYSVYSVAESDMGREYVEILAKAGSNNG
jgi:SPP1 family predicted phage head-tail adaptor